MDKILVFKNSGWCEKLKKSYEKGRYQPKNNKELEALKEFASEVITLKPVETKTESENDNSGNSATSETSKVGEGENDKSDEDKKDASDQNPTDTSSEETGEAKKTYSEEDIVELKKLAEEKKIKNWHTKSPATLAKELGLDD